MFNLGGGEILVILLLALIVLGPQRLPEAARKLGNAIGEVRRMATGFQTEIKAALDEVDLNPTSTSSTSRERPVRRVVTPPVDASPIPAEGDAETEPAPAQAETETDAAPAQAETETEPAPADSETVTPERPESSEPASPPAVSEPTDAEASGTTPDAEAPGRDDAVA